MLQISTDICPLLSMYPAKYTLALRLIQMCTVGKRKIYIESLPVKFESAATTNEVPARAEGHRRAERASPRRQI